MTGAQAPVIIIVMNSFMKPNVQQQKIYALIIPLRIA